MDRNKDSKPGDKSDQRSPWSERKQSQSERGRGRGGTGGRAKSRGRGRQSSVHNGTGRPGRMSGRRGINARQGGYLADHVELDGAANSPTSVENCPKGSVHKHSTNDMPLISPDSFNPQVQAMEGGAITWPVQSLGSIHASGSPMIVDPTKEASLPSSTENGSAVATLSPSRTLSSAVPLESIPYSAAPGLHLLDPSKIKAEDSREEPGSIGTSLPNQSFAAMPHLVAINSSLPPQTLVQHSQEPQPLMDTSSIQHEDKLEVTISKVFQFSSIGSKLSKKDLIFYCETVLGDNVEVSSLDMLGGGKARAIVKNLTVEEMSGIDAKKTHRIRGQEFSIELEDYSETSNEEPEAEDNRCTIEVRKLPDGFDSDFLELYFQQPKSGGSPGCVKSISFVCDGVAHVTMHTSQVAEAVISKAHHSIGGKSFQVKYLSEKRQEFELDKIFLRGVPDVEDEFLLLFIGSQLKKSHPDEFDIARHKNVAVITFTQKYTIPELEEMMESVKSKPLRKVSLEAELYKVCSCVRLSNCTENYTQDKISSYFASTESGGQEKSVESVEMLGNGEALVSFEFPEDAQKVSTSQHRFFGKKATVVLSDQFGKCKHDEKSVATCKVQVDHLVVIYLKKAPKLLENELSSYGVTLEYDSKAGCLTVTPSKDSPALWNVSCEKKIRAFIKKRVIVEPAVQLPVSAEAQAYLSSQLSNLETENCDQFFIKQFSKDNSTIAFAGDREPVQLAIQKVKEIYDMHTLKTESMPLTPKEYTFFKMVKLDAAKKDFKDIKFSLEKNNSLSLTSTVVNLEKLSPEIKKLTAHVELPVQLDPRICQFLEKGGYTSLLKMIKKHPVAVVFTSQLQLILLFDPADEQSAQAAAMEISQSCIVYEDNLRKSFLELYQAKALEGFEEHRKQLEKEHWVSISVDKSSLVTVGFKAGADKTRALMLEYIRAKTTKEVPARMHPAVWKLLNSHMRDKWLQFVMKTKDLGLTLIEPDSLVEAQTPTVRIKGDCLLVDQQAHCLSSLKGSVQRRVVEKNQPGAASYFSSEKARLILNGIEANMKVVIELTEPGQLDEFSENDVSSLSGNFEKECTATLINGKKIVLYIGDITKFSKSDVMVNAANEDLKHIGGLALAIANAGGPVIQSDSNARVRSNGKVDTGNVWLTERVGGLPCQALIHAVGPRWYGGRNNEEMLLKRVCKNSLLACYKKYQSVSFPAISTGVFDYPVSKCAQVMISAFSDFLVQNPSSPLSEINIVLFKKQDSHFFVSALKSDPNLQVKLSQASQSPPTLHRYSSFSGTDTEIGTTTRRKRQGAQSASPVVTLSEKIKISKGGLLDIQADAYVNSTNGNIDLSSGAIARALLKAGGNALQTECTSKAPIRQCGDVVVTGPGRIKSCRHILHTVVSNYDGPHGKAVKVLRTAIQNCLRECSKLKLKSVAFPSIGTGNLRFPNDVCASVMLEEINNFLTLTPASLTAVHLVIFMDDTLQAFKVASRKMQASASPSSPGATPTRRTMSKKKHRTSQPPPKHDTVFRFGNVSVSVINGDITEELTDAIVVPTNSSLKLSGGGVAGAIAKKGGPQLQQHCDIMTENGMRLAEGKVVRTPPGNLKSTSVFHIVFESNDNKKFIRLIGTCLEEADKQGYGSISFPAIGTGVQGYPPADAALGMYKAIQQQSHNLKKLTDIRIVLLADMHSTFCKVFQNPAAYDTPGMIDRAKSYISSKFSSQGPAFPQATAENDSSVDDGFFLEENGVVILIYGDSTQALDEVENEIDKLIDKTFITEDIENAVVSKLSKERVANLMRQAKTFDVQVIIDEDLNRIRIKGNDTSVHKMKCSASEVLEEVKKAIREKEEAEEMHKTIKWIRADSNGEEEYSVDESYEIERAYRFGKGKGTFTYKSDFTIDFDNNQETDHNQRDKTCAVNRVDLLKEAENDIPSEWDKMPLDANGKEVIVHCVDLDSMSPEYAQIKSLFDATMHQAAPSTVTAQRGRLAVVGYGRTQYTSIVSIKRIQNPTLYSQYIARKKKMNMINPQGHQNERKLFHGTKPDNCDKINHSGFNRSYCGANATVYGKGVYYARDAEYSARSTYSPPDPSGHKYVYLARVLTGEFAQGAQNLLTPPAKDPRNPNILYDSVVDNVSSPGIFVVFQDAQNYPEYLITFC